MGEREREGGRDFLFESSSWEHNAEQRYLLLTETPSA